MRINLANRITLVRIFLVPALAIAMLDGRHVLALGVFVLAAVSDAADGIVARRLRQRTTLGAILDPLADKALILTAFVLLGRRQEPYLSLPQGLVALVIFRDVLIVVGVAVIHLVTGHVRWEPSWISKVNTNVQIYTVVTITLANALTSLGVGGAPLGALGALLQALIWTTAVTTSASGLDYAIRGVWMLSEQTSALNREE